MSSEEHRQPIERNYVSPVVEIDVIAGRIGPDWRLVAVASPDCFASRGMPGHRQDLLGHSCINMRHIMAEGLYAWEFEKDGQPLRVRVDGQLTFNNSYAMIDAALAGLGIAYVPENIVAAQRNAGALVQALDDRSPFFEGYDLYYPSRRQNLPVFKALTDALRHRVEEYMAKFSERAKQIKTGRKPARQSSCIRHERPVHGVMPRSIQEARRTLTDRRSQCHAVGCPLVWPLRRRWVSN